MTIPAHFSLLMWPHEAQTALKYFASEKIIVIGTQTPTSILRDAARQHLRLVVTEFLSAALDIAAHDLRLISVIGQGIRTVVRDMDLQISTSHETGISVAAISRLGQIGVDLMRTTLPDDWQDLAGVYLGDQHTASLIATPLSLQAQRFSQYWTQLEASLKCAGLGLTEYENQIQAAYRSQLSNIRTFSINTVPEYTASLAISGTTDFA